MSSRIGELAAKRRLLVARSALQRQTLLLDAATIGDGLHGVDRAVALLQRLRRSRWPVGVAMVALIILRRHAALRWLMRSLAVAGAAAQAGASLRRLAREASPQASTDR